MAVYDYATTFTQLLQQKYAKELCSVPYSFLRSFVLDHFAGFPASGSGEKV